MKKVIRICDICQYDGEEDKIAIGWYRDVTGQRWDVCLKHAKNVEDVGMKLKLYKEKN